MKMLSSETAFFFFQAEDGIRDLTVTGVQTCALPIWRYRSPAHRWTSQTPRHRAPWTARQRERSEERRVGKECRSRWSPDPQKKKDASYNKHCSLVATCKPDIGADHTSSQLRFMTVRS